MQPHRFVVDTEHYDSDLVKAEYEELLEQASEQADASIQFETLIVGENGEATITYIVSAGDSLGSIAKSFGTTSKAISVANNIEDADKLRPGQKLVIDYDDGVFVNVQSSMTIREFANYYELDKEELLSMNYFEDEELKLEEGWQVVVPLNQIEAEKKGLIEKEAFVKLDLPEPKEEVVVQELKEEDIQTRKPTRVEQKILAAQQPEENKDSENIEEKGYEQIVISAEQTEAHLENLKKQEEEAKKAAEEAKKAAEEARIAAEEAKKQAEIEKTAAAKRAAENARIKAEQARKNAQLEAKRAQDQRNARQAAQELVPVTCSANQCAHKGKCWTKPANGYCAETDPGNAWLCNAGFIEYNGTCVDKNKVPASTPRVPTGTTSQRYFNPHKVDPNVYGRGPGHCTAMAAYMWSQNFGIRIRDYWTGNAKNWLQGARNAGFIVNMTPAVGSLMVTGNGYGVRGAYGHVMYVESVDLANGVVVVVDMNYRGTYIATRRTQAINAARGFIHPTRR